MNKILIPAILTATIMIAGMFAIVDVDKAMAGHLPSIGAVTSANIAANTIVDADVGVDALTGDAMDDVGTFITIRTETDNTVLTLSGSGNDVGVVITSGGDTATADDQTILFTVDNDTDGADLFAIDASGDVEINGRIRIGTTDGVYIIEITNSTLILGAHAFTDTGDNFSENVLIVGVTAADVPLCAIIADGSSSPGQLYITSASALIAQVKVNFQAADAVDIAAGEVTIDCVVIDVQ